MDNTTENLFNEGTNLFQEVDAEKKEQHQKEIEQNPNKDFITELPDWDLLPPNDYVKRVVRQ